MITLIVFILTFIFAVGSISPLLITVDLKDIVEVGQ